MQKLDQDVVPFLDLSHARPQQLAEILETSSCVLLRGHEVPTELIARMVSVSREFFGLPVAEKQRAGWSGKGPWAGWLAEDWPGVEDDSTVPKVSERFEISLPAPDAVDGVLDDDGLDRWASRFAPWPQHPVAMRAVWIRFFAEMRRLSSRLVTDLAEVYGAPSEDLEAWTLRQESNLAVNFYPAQRFTPPERHLRQTAHSDIGFLTLLWATDAPGGLEIPVPGGDWARVVIPEDTILLQAAELLGRWTNYRIRPSVHRVGHPPRELAAEAERTSIAYFHYPDKDAHVTVSPRCLRELERPLRPLRVGDYIERKMPKAD